MSRLLSAITFIVFTFTLIPSVSGQWTAQTSGTTKDLMDAYMVSATHGWAVGYDGTILATTNGGAAWTAQSSAITTHLYGVFFLDESNGWIVGKSAKVLKTTNGGATWSQTGTGITGDLWDVQFLDTSVGYVTSSNGIFKSTDGGANWSQMPTSTNAFYQLHFLDQQTGWCVGSNGKIRATADGGSTWATQSNGTTGTLYGVSFTSPTTGYTVDQNGNWQKTTDGGSTWSSQGITNGFNYLMRVVFTSETNGWVCGMGGEIFSTTNGGDTWVLADTQTSELFYAIHFGGGTGIAVGTEGVIYKYGGTAGGGGGTDAPTITSFSPAVGPAGTSVTITGTNFTGATSVKFNNTTAANFTVASATSITTTVPVGATTGKISVVTPNGTATSTDDFTVGDAASLAITSFTPATGPVGTAVTITGTGFNATAANNTVKFNGTVATVLSSTETSISTTVPSGATTGKITVTTQEGTATSSTDFTVSAGGAGGFGLLSEIKDLLGSPGDFFVKDTYLYVVGAAGADGYLSVYDVSDKKNPVFKYNNVYPGKKLDVLHYDGVHLYSVGENGLLVFDIADPVLPVLTAYHDSVLDGSTNKYFRASYKNLTKSGNLLFANGNLWRLLVADFSDVNNPVYKDGFEFNFNTVRDFEVIAENTLLLNDESGLRIVDFSNPADLQVMTTDDPQYMDLPATVEQMVVTADKTKAITYSWGIGSSQLSVVDLATRTVLNSFDIKEHTEQLFTLALNSDNTLLYAGGHVSFYIFDVSDLSNIQYKSSEHPGEGHLRVWGDYLYVRGSSTSVVIYGEDEAGSGGGSGGPAITGFAPQEGVAGTAVTINGSGFDAVAANNIVRFNGITATVTASTSSSLTTSVPAGAITGPVTVTVGESTATSATDFVVTGTGSSLVISAVNPGSGAVGTAVTISGAKFDPVAANNVVKFNGTAAVVTSSTASTIKTTVPAGATTGKVSVTVGGQTVTSSSDFTVSVGGGGSTNPPSISSISPSSGPVGTMVVIEGSNFDLVARNNIVEFNGKTARVSTGTINKLVVTVPIGSSTGAVTITNSLGAATGGTFTVNGTMGAVSNKPVLVKDIDHSILDDSEVRQVTSFKGKTFFVANDGYGEIGEELWMTDGTEAGTQVLKDIYSGSSGSPLIQIIHNDLMYFTAVNESGTELWVTDGTEAGTRLVKDINAGSGNAYPRNFVSVGSKLFFIANDGVVGDEWWVTDGTTEGTILLKDINTGSEGVDGGPAIGWNNKLYFYANDEAKGIQFYVSDGTPEGTIMLTPGEKYFYDFILDADLIVYKDKVWFSFQDKTYGIEVWTTDGTVAGTKMFKDFYSSTSSAYPTSFHVINDKLIFLAYADEGFSNYRYLHVTDGTVAGTQKVTKLYALGDIKWAFFKGNYYLQGSDGIGKYNLWKTDGTTAGTFKVKDGTESPENFVVSGEKMFFTALNAVHGKELWVTDGTTDGTVMVKDINVGSDGSDIRLILPFNDKVYFAAQYEDNNYNLYESDGTEAGTVLLLPDDSENTTHTLPVDDYSFLFNLPGLGHNSIYVPARYLDNGVELWRVGPEISGVTGVGDEIAAGVTTRAYPNPFDQTLTIEIAGEQNPLSKKTLQMIDMIGRQVLTKSFSGNSLTLQLPLQQPGVYMLRIHNEAGLLLGHIKLMKD